MRELELSAYASAGDDLRLEQCAALTRGQGDKAGSSNRLPIDPPCAGRLTLGQTSGGATSGLVHRQVCTVQILPKSPSLTLFNRTLSRDNKHSVEKEQVIKLIRAIVDLGSERHMSHSGVGSGSVPLSDAVMRALIAVAEYPEDPFKPICVQTLTEIRELPLLHVPSYPIEAD